MINYYNTTKKQWAQIAYNLALQLTGEENHNKAMKILEKEKELTR